MAVLKYFMCLDVCELLFDILMKTIANFYFFDEFANLWMYPDVSRCIRAVFAENQTCHFCETVVQNGPGYIGFGCIQMYPDVSGCFFVFFHFFEKGMYPDVSADFLHFFTCLKQKWKRCWFQMYRSMKPNTSRHSQTHLMFWLLSSFEKCVFLYLFYFENDTEFYQMVFQKFVE